MFDIPGQIRKAINEFLLWVAKTGLKPVMNALGSTALSTPDITGNPQVKAVWTTSLIVANGIYVLFVVLGGFILASRETLQSQYGFKQIAPRLAVGAVVSNVSLILCGKAIEATNALTAAIAGQEVDGPNAARAISGILDQPLSGTSPNILLVLLVIAVAVLGLVVVITFILRVALLVLLFGISPLAMVCHASPQTEGIAYTWWRAFFACLGLQVAQAVIVVGTVKVFLTPSGLVLLGVPATTSGLLGVLVCVTMLWLLIKVPGLMKQFVLAPIGMQSRGRGLIGQLIQAFVMIKTLGAAAGLTGAATAGSRAARTQPAARQRAATSGTRTARPAPAPGGRGARPTTPRPAPPRPSPTGPVAFSNAPTTQTPLAVPAGTNGAPAFSHPAQPGTPAPAPTGPAPAAPFSHPSPAQPPSSRPAAGPTPVAFSGATPTPASPTPPGPAPAATFSAPQAPQSAPRRPPAPVTPVFSSAPPTPKTRPTAARRTTAARPSSAGGPPPVTGTPAASPGPASTARRSPRPAPPPASPPPSRPRPTGSASPVFRPAPPSPPPPPAAPSPPPAAPSPPPAKRRPRGGK
jgi:hypothetical protein